MGCAVESGAEVFEPDRDHDGWFAAAGSFWSAACCAFGQNLQSVGEPLVVAALGGDVVGLVVLRDRLDLYEDGASLIKLGRHRFAVNTEALELTMRTEGLIPALESSHAFVQAFKEAPELTKDDAIIINMSGRGDKDIFTIAHAFDDPSWKEFIVERGKQYRS